MRAVNQGLLDLKEKSGMQVIMLEGSVKYLRSAAFRTEFV